MADLLNFGGQKKPQKRSEAPVGSTSFVVIDTELTGLNPRKDSIVSIAGVRMTGSRISLGDPFYRLVKPKCPMTRESVIIHGITPSDVAAEAGSYSVLSEFASFCGKTIIVGHYVGIDFDFINREMEQVLGMRLENRVLDTAELYAWVLRQGLLESRLPEPPRTPDLYRLADFFDIDVAEAHHALVDAFTTAQLFQRFQPLLQKAGAEALEDILRIGIPFKGGDRFRASGEFSNF